MIDKYKIAIRDSSYPSIKIKELSGDYSFVRDYARNESLKDKINYIILYIFRDNRYHEISEFKKGMEYDAKPPVKKDIEPWNRYRKDY